MRIYDLETEDRIAELLSNYQYVVNIRNSLSDNRSKYRDFAKSINLDFQSLQACCDTFERNLLIDIYTFAEQLFKNFYYQLVEKDRSENEYINTFINEKLKPDRFSPNVKYEEIEKNISKELVGEFRFIINVNREEIKSYNELIRSRHAYAHRGRYSFENEFMDVINVERYLCNELCMIIVEGKTFRINYQKEIFQLVSLSKELASLAERYKTTRNVQLKKNINEKVKNLREICRAFITKYGTYIAGCELLKNTFDAICDVSHCDIRATDGIMELLIRLNDSIQEERIEGRK